MSGEVDGSAKIGRMPHNNSSDDHEPDPQAHDSQLTAHNPSWGFTTRAIHVAQEPDPTTGAVTTPIYQTSTYAQEDIGVHRGYEYSRTDNPTREVVEAVIASLEGGAYGLAFASGMAAEGTIMNMSRSGDQLGPARSARP